MGGGTLNGRSDPDGRILWPNFRKSYLRVGVSFFDETCGIRQDLMSS